jgi:hypothetical protein
MIIFAITTVFIVIVVASTAGLVRYHRQQGGVDPTTAPSKLTVTWNQ